MYFDSKLVTDSTTFLTFNNRQMVHDSRIYEGASGGAEVSSMFCASHLANGSSSSNPNTSTARYKHLQPVWCCLGDKNETNDSLGDAVSYTPKIYPEILKGYKSCAPRLVIIESVFVSPITQSK
jgi:hypothetical protein